jgi:hypothetical protein
VVTDVEIETPNLSASGHDKASMLYLALELASERTSKLCEWKFRLTIGAKLSHVEYAELQGSRPDATEFVNAVDHFMNCGGADLIRGRTNLLRRDTEGARKAFEKVLRQRDASQGLRLEALVGQGIVMAVTGSEPIPLPDVALEYRIMDGHFCSTCGQHTEARRAGGMTRYLESSIVDCWLAECENCKNQKEILFAVPK